jgi:hypothetical protein
MGTPNSIRILYNTSLLTLSSCIADVLSHCTPIFSPVSDECKRSDLLCQNPHWWSPIISSMYGLNLDKRILDKILYEVDSSDIPW